MIKERRNSSMKCEREDSNHANTIQKMKYDWLFRGRCWINNLNEVKFNHTLCNINTQVHRLVPDSSPVAHPALDDGNG